MWGHGDLGEMAGQEEGGEEVGAAICFVLFRLFCVCFKSYPLPLFHFLLWNEILGGTELMTNNYHFVRYSVTIQRIDLCYRRVISD